MRLAQAYDGVGLSLRDISAWADAVGVAWVGDMAVLNRLRQADVWLEQVAHALLAERLPTPVALVLVLTFLPGRRVRRCLLVDATCLCEPGADRASWQLHEGYDLQAGRAVQVGLTDGHGGESLRRFTAVLDGFAGARRPETSRSLSALPATSNNSFAVSDVWKNTDVASAVI